VVDSGAVEKLAHLQLKYLEKAKKAIAVLKTNTYSETLRELLLFAVERTKKVLSIVRPYYIISRDKLGAGRALCLYTEKYD
jgi:hypothetical protein